MARYEAYVEIAGDGLCLIHVPALPGCIARAPTRDEAWRQLPQAIRACHTWLRRHDEPALDDDDPIEIDLAAEYSGTGPFDPGDAAALLPPDREPLTQEEMEQHFRLMSHARADLLALTQHLPTDLLDWQPEPGSFTIRRLLRHVGNAEEWYVSRLVPLDTLPPEWEDDEDLPIFEFLAMERRTAIARLRQLTGDERPGVFRPTIWTAHPDEAWTARKALRRALEHEREHTAQVREILAAYRAHLLAHLAAERKRLLAQLEGLDEWALTQSPVFDDWAVKDLLAHIAAWDRWEDQAMRSMVAGQEPDLAAVQDFDAANAAFVAAWRDRSWSDVLVELYAARADWVAWLESLPLEEFFRPRSYAGYDWSFYTTPLPVQWQHDAEHAEQLAVWRKAEGF
jgi:predicted RNase H-like HicB family nuclease/uncharacterized damage-inducible protein DinB